MTEKEKINIAKIAIDKKYDFEELYYSDYMRGKEELTDDVWEYVIECEEIGTFVFFSKYRDT